MDIAIDLVSLIEQRSSVRLKREAIDRKDGPEYWGNCPFCNDGRNRFHVWPLAQRPHYWCRVCNSHGDHIQFLREYESLSFTDACQELGIDPSDIVTDWQEKPTSERDDPPPSARWQESARIFIERAERYLWLPNAPAAVQALAYLHGRGFSDETIKKAHLGYCPLDKESRWFLDSFEHWGIDPEQLREDQRAKGGVRIPDGIIIPWFEGSIIWKIAVKRPGEKLDYGQVLGSGEGMYGVDSIEYDKPLMMVEGEFDCLSVQQEAGDLVACVATGSVTRGRSMRWLADLSMASCVLQSFDEDEPDARGVRAGDEGAEYWLERLKHATRWSPALWKDPNELLQAQLAGTNDICTLRQWVEYGILAAQDTCDVADAVLASVTAVLPTETEPTLPVIKPDYQRAIDVQAEYERLSASHRVKTPEGPGTIWDMSQLRQHIEQGTVRVTLDRRQKNPEKWSLGVTEVFPCQDLEPVLTELSLSF